MKKIVSLLLVVVLVFSLVACNSSSEQPAPEPAPETETAETAEQVEEPQNEDDLIDDDSWDELKSLGKVETENGVFFVTITVPAELVGEEITQADIDAEAGEHYTSGKLNEDGSVTYKMTKMQHKAMLDSIAESIEEGISEMIDDPDFAFSEITHNKDFTSFDVHLTTEEIGLMESFAAIAFYMYGGLYNIFSGKGVDNIEVNYYSSSGELISTGNSSDAED